MSSPGGGGRPVRPVPIVVRVNYSGAEGKPLPDAVASVFDKSGKLIASAPVPKQEKSEVRIPISPQLLGTNLRVLVGPPQEAPAEGLAGWMQLMLRKAEPRYDRPAPEALIRRGGKEKRIRPTAANEVLDYAVLAPDWSQWLRCNCMVRGRVVKQVHMPDGTTQEMGVCHACVLIYEVDKIPKIVATLPDQVIVRLKDELWRLRHKWPPPPPGPPELIAEASLVRPIGPRPGPVVPKISPVVLSGLSTSPSVALEPVFMASSATQIRQAFMAKAELMPAILCHFDWLWSYISTDFIKCVCTDHQGRFETTITYPCGGDKPDLYFKVWQCIGGVAHKLYDPGPYCHTYWNYVCGTEVVLQVTDPAAIVCAPPIPVDPPDDVPGLWIMPFAVGGIALSAIKSSGLTDGSTYPNAPFGGKLGFRHGWSGVIPLSGNNQPFYYRYLYKKDTEDDWHEFTTPVTRHYVKELPGKLPTFPVCSMGPKTVPGKSLSLYRFKPSKPEDCDDFVPGGTNYWPTDTWFGDIYTGFLDTPGLPGGVDVSAGKYLVKLEIYDKDGDQVMPGAGTFTFIVPTVKGSDGTWESRKALAAEVDGGGFVFALHIDNRTCGALIDAPTIGGASAGDECGMLAYTPGSPTPVHIAFHATHPANFAVFSFYIRRGINTIHPASGEVAAAAAGGYTGDGSGNFTRGFTSAALLGACPEAAFAEVLNVDAKATNGWDRLWQYDADYVRAFAMTIKK